MGFRQNMRRFDQKDNEKSMNEKYEHTHTRHSENMKDKHYRAILL